MPLSDLLDDLHAAGRRHDARRPIGSTASATSNRRPERS
jgi:hypothetical protein